MGFWQEDDGNVGALPLHPARGAAPKPYVPESCIDI